MKVHNAVFVMLGIASLGVAQAAPAAAEPNREVIDLECDTLGTVQVLVFSNGPSSPGLVAGSNQVVIPYELHLDGTFTPTGGDPETFSEDVVKPAPRHGRTDHCTFHEEETNEFGTLVLDGEVFVSYTPVR